MSTVNTISTPQWCNDAWDMVWQKLWNPTTRLFYDFIPDNGNIIASLPTPEEIANNIPNPCGWRTGMEDSMLNAGNMLECMIARWQICGDAESRQLAREVFGGMNNCAKQAKVPGFLPRSLSPLDGKTHYINSSRDQYTHFIYSSWRYFKSDMADDAEKADIIHHLTAFAQRCHRNVTAENNFDMLCEDGSAAAASIMAGDSLNHHEIMRLSMFYLAAWSVSGDELYWQWYQEIFPAALERNETISYDRKWRAYELLQMQYSLRLIYEEDPDCKIKERIGNIMLRSAEYCNGFIIDITDTQKYWSCAPEEWRTVPCYYMNRRPVGGKAYMIPDLNLDYYDRCYTVLRSLAEAMLVQLLAPGFEVSGEKAAMFNAMASKIDYGDHHSYAPLLLLDAWYSLELSKQ